MGGGVKWQPDKVPAGTWWVRLHWLWEQARPSPHPPTHHLLHRSVRTTSRSPALFPSASQEEVLKSVAERVRRERERAESRVADVEARAAMLGAKNQAQKALRKEEVGQWGLFSCMLCCCCRPRCAAAWVTQDAAGGGSGRWKSG